MGDRSEYAYVVLAVVVVLIAIVLMTSGMWLPEDVAIRTVQAAGYSKARVVERSWFAVGFRGCDKSDHVRFTVEGVNPAGATSRVYVCSGLWKAGTIRVP